MTPQEARRKIQEQTPNPEKLFLKAEFVGECALAAMHAQSMYVSGCSEQSRMDWEECDKWGEEVLAWRELFKDMEKGFRTN